MVENKLILYYKDDIEGEKAFNGIVITEYNYSDDLMGKTQLSGSFVHPNTSLLELFDKKQYTYFRDNKFYLINPPSLSKEYGADNGMTKYNCVFTSEKDLLDNIPFTDLVSTPDSTRYFSASRDFKFYGDLAEFGDRLYANLAQNTNIDYVINIHGVIVGANDWLNNLRNILQGKNQDIFFEFNISYASVFSALNIMYETYKQYKKDNNAFEGDDIIWYLKNVNYGTELSPSILPTIFITDTIANIGNFKNPTHIFEYGQGKGLEKISVEPTNNPILTRIAGHGSTQNIPFDYPVIYNGNTKVNHPYKRNYLMPNIFIEKLKQKYVTDNPNGYDPNTTIIDYYDAVDGDGRIFPNKIDLDFPLINKEVIQFDIKPSIEGVTVGGNRIDKVKSIITTNFTEAYDENTGDYEQSTFQIELFPLGFDLYGHANEKEEMVINMTSGLCVGCSFKVNIDKDWLPSYDKKLFRCVTAKPTGGAYDLADWELFFNNDKWLRMMDIVNNASSSQGNNIVLLELINIWTTYFKPLRDYYKDIAQVVYGSDFASKYLLTPNNSIHPANPIEEYISGAINNIYDNINNVIVVNGNLLNLQRYLSDKNVTTELQSFEEGFEYAGYKKRIMDLQYYFLKNPPTSGDYTPIITDIFHLTPTPEYSVGKLWISSVRSSASKAYPNSTSDPIVITLQKDVDTFGTMLPTANIKPVAGDTFVITGINLPAIYVQTAENNLDAALKDRLLADNVDKLNYSIPFDEKFIMENPTLRTDYLMCGNVISFKINSDTITRTIKQLSIEVNDNNPLPKYICSVSDEFNLKTKQRIGKVPNTNDVRDVSESIKLLDEKINNINITAGRFIPRKVYELEDSLTILGAKTEGRTVFGEVGSIEALATTAKSVADSKNTCWTSKPKPPYRRGDQWVVSSDDADEDFLEGDNLFCLKTRLNDSFVSADWSKTKYTRDIDFDDVIGLKDRPIGKKVFGSTNSLSDDISTTNSRFGTLPKDINNNERTVSDLIGDVPVGKKVFGNTNSLSKDISTTNSNISSLSNDISTTNSRFGDLPKDADNKERTVSDLMGDIPIEKKVFGNTNSLSNDISTTKNVANSKNKCWTTKPIPPYYAGDQWLVSDTDADADFLEGDTLFCKTTRLTNLFDSADWSKIRYTRDIDFDDVIGLKYRPSGKKVFGDTDSLSKDILTANSRFGTLPKDANNDERTVSDLIGNVPVGKKVIEITNSLSNDISTTNSNISSLSNDISSLSDDISTTNSRFGTLPKDINNDERTVSDLIGDVPIGKKVIEITDSLNNDISTTNSKFGTLPKDINDNERTVSDLIGNIPVGQKVFGERDSIEYLISFIADKLSNKKPLTLTGAIDGSNKVFETDKIFHMGFGDLYLNGVKQFRGVDYEEKTPKKIEFLEDKAPKEGDKIVFEATENTDKAVVVFKDEAVKEICDNAFFDTYGVLTYDSVSLIDSLGDSPDGYFEGKTDIVTFSELQYFVGLGVIEANAFQSCSSLRTINMPRSIRKIEDSAFQGCSNLQNVIIPKSVKVIGDYSFSECENITSITIPYLVGNIGSNCFKDCINLTSVIVESLTPPTLGEQCFFNDDKLETIYVPESSVTSYKDAVGWIDYKDIIKPIRY